jgi:hypothetical protein
MENFFLKGELHERNLGMDKQWQLLAQQKAAFSHEYATTAVPQNAGTGKSRRQANYSTAQKAGHLPGSLFSQATAAARGGAAAAKKAEAEAAAERSGGGSSGEAGGSSGSSGSSDAGRGGDGSEASGEGSSGKHTHARLRLHTVEHGV